MRVISGTAKGRKLTPLEGDDVRPTTDRVKEAVFSIIQFHIEGRSFLDLFAGSGQMGIEALSRGAAKAVFVDQSRRSIGVINKNLSTVGFESRARVVNSDSLSYLKTCREQFDLAFLDPPYSTGLLQQALPLAVKIMKKTGFIICESPINEELPEKIDEFTLDRNYRYGKIKVSIYCIKDGC